VSIPYGVDESFKVGNGNYIKEKFGIKEYILCVGRIHHQKNQLSLMKAMAKESIPIILVGSINDMKYFRECMMIKKENTLILQDVNRETLKSIYKGAKVHVLPSWIEYPGLASLEAGIAGCKVVSTEIGSTKEIFSQYVDYCDPSSIDSIYHAVMSALHKKPTPDLRNHIEDNYTWSKIASKVVEVYDSLV
jgi:glycosyltransferase involved in cell wall biosynthesis